MTESDGVSDFVNNFLMHHGVKGMKWGVRSSDIPGVSRSTSKEASKDAKEFARAKMFYGQGAGTRRKLIKATVEAKSKKDPAYKKAFDHHLAQQDLSNHASKARGERKRKDRTEAVVKTAKGTHRSLNGGFGSVSLNSAILAGGIVAAKRAGADKIVADAARQAYSSAQQGQRRRRSESFLRNAGFDNL